MAKKQRPAAAAVAPEEEEEPLYDPESFAGQEPAAEEESPAAVPQPTEEELDLFREQMALWIRLDDQVRKLSVALRERRVQQRAVTERIQQFMITYRYENVSTHSGMVKSSVRMAKVSIRLAEVKERIAQLGHLSGEELVEAIFAAERPVVEKKSIRRIIPKVSMNLDL